MHSFHKQLDTLLVKHKHILVTTHQEPDHDAVSALIAMGLFLDKEYPQHHITLAVEGPAATIGHHLPHFSTITWVPRLYDVAQKNDVIIVLDSENPERITKEPQLFTTSFKPLVYIDHHPTHVDNYTLLYHDPSAVSNCQILAEVLYTKNSLLTREICTILLNGILADSGTFRFIQAANAKVLSTSERLIQVGNISIEEVELRLSQVPLSAIPILEQYFHNLQTVTIAGLPSLVYSFLPRTALKQFRLDDITVASDYFKFHYLKRIEDRHWGFIVKPKNQEQFDISFRSTALGPIINTIAEHFGGGGHPRAAAASFNVLPGRENMQSEGVCQLVLDAIKAIDPKLIWNP